MAKVTDLQVARRMVNKYADAQARGLKCTLSFKRFKQLMKQKTCFFTGVEFAPFPITPDNQPGPLHMTIDRVDNSIGYTDDNVVACTYAFNQLKGALTLQQIEQLYKGVNKVIKRNDKKNPNRLKPVPLPRPAICKFKKKEEVKDVA